jgi:hypothetical protein
MKWLTRIGVVVVALVAVLALVPLFVSLDDYVPGLEKELSIRLGTPVSIDDLDGALLPYPHVKVEGIALGKSEDITAGKITLTPDVWSLLSSTKVIRTVELEDVTLSQQAIGVLVELAQRDQGSGATLRVEKIKLKTALIKLEPGSFGPFDATVELGANGEKGDVRVTTQDGALDLRLTPVEKHYAIQLTAKSWTPPLGPPIRFDTLDVKGTATTSGAELNELYARLYGGTVTGNVSARWDEGVGMKGRLEVKQVELKDVVALLSPKTRVSGRLTAAPTFSASAAKAAQLDEALRLESNFSVHNGVLYGLDLPSAVGVLTKQGHSGGQTQFDQLTGHLVATGRSYRFTQLQIASGALSAKGNATIAANKNLSGQMTATLGGAGARAKVPLVLGGSLDSPMVYPNATALLGSAAAARAAGTAVLGPEVGSTPGKVGEIVEGFFEKGGR